MFYSFLIYIQHGPQLEDVILSHYSLHTPDIKKIVQHKAHILYRGLLLAVVRNIYFYKSILSYLFIHAKVVDELNCE